MEVNLKKLRKAFNGQTEQPTGHNTGCADVKLPKL
ncbi:unnamed protein product, partial [Allacma fusca]